MAHGDRMQSPPKEPDDQGKEDGGLDSATAGDGGKPSAASPDDSPAAGTHGESSTEENLDDSEIVPS